MKNLFAVFYEKRADTLQSSMNAWAEYLPHGAVVRQVSGGCQQQTDEYYGGFFALVHYEIPEEAKHERGALR